MNQKIKMFLNKKQYCKKVKVNLIIRIRYSIHKLQKNNKMMNNYKKNSLIEKVQYQNNKYD